MSRVTLPNRRPNETTATEWQGHAFTVTVGYDLAGMPREVFSDMAKAGSAMQAVLADACVLISIALQHGIEPAALSRSLGVVPGWSGEDGPASPIGALMAVLLVKR